MKSIDIIRGQGVSDTPVEEAEIEQIKPPKQQKTRGARNQAAIATALDNISSWLGHDKTQATMST